MRVGYFCLTQKKNTEKETQTGFTLLAHFSFTYPHYLVFCPSHSFSFFLTSTCSEGKNTVYFTGPIYYEVLLL